MIEIGVGTKIGNRTKNEDSYIADEGAGLFAVADGMGGEPAGEVASKKTLDVFSKYIHEVECGGILCLDDYAGAIFNGVNKADKTLVETTDPDLIGMGSTLCGMLIDGKLSGLAYIFNVGDSMVYRLGNSVLEQMTKEDNQARIRMESGEPEWVASQYDNMVTNFIGSGIAEPSMSVVNLHVGDKFVICTDGIGKGVDKEVIRKILLVTTAQEAADLLSRFGGISGDNSTAIVLYVS